MFDEKTFLQFFISSIFWKARATMKTTFLKLKTKMKKQIFFCIIFITCDSSNDWHKHKSHAAQVNPNSLLKRKRVGCISKTRHDTHNHLWNHHSHSR